MRMEVSPMERLMTAREYARSVRSDEREAAALTRKLERRANKLPEPDRRKIGSSFALPSARWAQLEAD
jgi:hypothetical protein